MQKRSGKPHTRIQAVCVVLSRSFQMQQVHERFSGKCRNQAVSPPNKGIPVKHWESWIDRLPSKREMRGRILHQNLHPRCSLSALSRCITPLRFTVFTRLVGTFERMPEHKQPTSLLGGRAARFLDIRCCVLSKQTTSGANKTCTV